ncbi:MAG: hypothetical protein IKQ72_10320 [Bacteroidaceae bacterium]|nr:hypothetical protein [Bacteroidaceae bacterium]
MAFEQNSDWTSGSRNAQKSFSKQLIDAAKELGIYLTKPVINIKKNPNEVIDFLLQE